MLAATITRSQLTRSVFILSDRDVPDSAWLPKAPQRGGRQVGPASEGVAKAPGREPAAPASNRYRDGCFRCNTWTAHR